MLRRSFVKSLACLPLASAVIGASSSIAHAAWPAGAFKSEELEKALNDLFGSSSYAEDGVLSLKAPEIAENGAVVPVEVGSSVPAVTAAIFVEKNPRPLAFHVQLEGSASFPIASRIKMRDSSHVLAVVQDADGKLHGVRKEVKVTIGGCGG